VTYYVLLRFIHYLFYTITYLLIIHFTYFLSKYLLIYFTLNYFIDVRYFITYQLLSLRWET